MEYEQDNETKDGGILERLKESPRTVSALIIILIVGAALYAFSGDNTPSEEELAAVEEEAIVAQEEQEGQTEEEQAAAEGEGESAEESMPAPLPEPQKTETSYIEVAQSGEGVTHLARRAAQRYLDENDAGYEVTAEHRVYIEDYIKDRVGSQMLELGESQEIPFDLIQEAVEAAGTLNDTQLQSLSRFV